MGIQSSINSLLSQAQSLAAFYTGLGKVDKIVGDTTATKNEAKIQTDIAAGNAPMKDGKVDSEWLQKRREEFANKIAFNSDSSLTEYGKHHAQILRLATIRGKRLNSENNEFYNNPIVRDYLKSVEVNSELKNEVAGKVARSSVEARTASINKTKSNFDEHTASLIKYYSKGSGNP